MNATIIPKAKMNAFANGYLTKAIAAIMNTIPIETAIIDNCLVSRFNSCVSGLSTLFCFWVSLAILPNSVFIPVANAIARAVPAPTVVPEYTKLVSA